MFDELKDKKVVLFGAGENGKRLLTQLIDSGITPAYFVDNNPVDEFMEYAQNKRFHVVSPKSLLNEDGQLKIIITPYSPLYEEIKDQLQAMGLGGFIYNNQQHGCAAVNTIAFTTTNHFSGASLCCADFKHIPYVPLGETGKDTIEAFIKMRSETMREFDPLQDLIAPPPSIHKRL